MKREQEDSEDPDQIVQRVKLHDGFLSGTEFYWALPERKKRTLGLYGFDFLPTDLQALIAKMDAGGLLSLAQANRMFADIARNDQVWKDLFQRDFPHDWKYCQGELPFFVITEDHPLWQPGLINEFDKSGWKRFYLHTRAMYYRKVEDDKLQKLPFSTWYKKYQKKRDTKLDIAHLCHLFVCVMSWLYKGRGAFRFEANTPNDSRMIFWQNIHVNEWLRPYVLCSLIHDDRDYFETDLFSEYTGISEIPFFREYRKKFDIKQSQWLEALDIKLFSNADKESLIFYLKSKVERPGIFHGFDGLEQEEKIKIVVFVSGVWDMLSDAYNNIKSIYTDPTAFMLYYFSGIPFSMITHSVRLKEYVKFKMEENPFESIKFNFQKKRIFTLPRLDKELSEITNPLTFFTNKTNTEELLNMFQGYFSAPRNIKQKYHPETDTYTYERTSLFFIESRLCMQCNSDLVTGACGRCGKAFYCSKGCQKAHWHSGEHKC
jgi:hypothetical protein